jgi:hypothetical protein
VKRRKDNAIQPRARATTSGPKGRVSPTEALNLLIPALAPMAAATELTRAVHDKRCQIIGNGVVIPAHIAPRLMVVARSKKARWTAHIVGTFAVGGVKPSDQWEFDADEVKALLPPPSPAEAPPRSDRRKPGPRPTLDWPKHVAREIVRALRAGDKIPTAAALAQSCEDNLHYQPDIRAVQRHVEYLLNKLLG